MEATGVPEAKYQKLATEYAKLRAQASVLKKAVLEEQAKNAGLREQLRQRESSLRRSEQEVDSLGFRSKQMEHRVAALQEELAKTEGRKREKEQKRGGAAAAAVLVSHGSFGGAGDDFAQDAIIFEELQKKIMENAQLTSLIDDKERELQLHTERINSLEQTLEKRATEQSDLEKRLRRDLETLQCRNSELETKLVEAASMLGSEDALSASGSDSTTPLHNTHQHYPQQQHNHTAHVHTHSSPFIARTSEERIAFLEKEVSHWRAQYEIAKLNETFTSSNNSNNGGSDSKEQLKAATAPTAVGDANCSCSSTAAGLSVKPSFAESKSVQRARDSLKEPLVPPTTEQLIYNNFSKKFEDLLRAKCMAESRVSTFETEAEHLQNCLENATHELKAKDEQMQSINQALQMLEEDLATTRFNYEEQISVLTEQVISLSEQLAACK